MTAFECQCGQMTEYQPVFYGGRERFKPTMCPGCVEKATQSSRAAEDRQRNARLIEAWDKICPASYNATNPDFPLMNRPLLEAILRWDYATANGMGIGLWGETGLRKTRMMFLLLKKLHFSGVKVFAASSLRLAKCFAIRYGKDQISGTARDAIRKCYEAEVLLLDDVGKQKFSKDGLSEFFYMLEERTSRGRPILWTANVSGDDLIEKIRGDAGEANAGDAAKPIVRRLEDFAELIHVSEE